jgi:sulfur relay (sulfurtransferase) DsrF/TusC family protein
MTDNNKVLLSNLKTYQKLNRLYKVQEALAENETLRKAKANQKESINTSVNPIS